MLFPPNDKDLGLVGLPGPAFISLVVLFEYSLTFVTFYSSIFFFGKVFSYSCNCLIKPMLGQMIDRRDLTKFKAFQNSNPFSFIK